MISVEPSRTIREQQNGAVRRHVEISLQTLIDRQNLQMADYLNRQIEGQNVPGLEGLIAQVEGHLDRLNERLEGRLRELEMERHCTIADITHLGRAWVLPHPERTTPALAPMVRDDEIERIAIAFVTQHEEARGWQVESVESENRGFDLISRRSHPEDPKTFVEVRFIEVKGRAGVGEIALTANEYKTAGRLKSDYWLYAVFNCGGTPELHAIQDPSRLGWVPVVQVEHYHIDPEKILAADGGGNRQSGAESHGRCGQPLRRPIKGLVLTTNLKIRRDSLENLMSVRCGIEVAQAIHAEGWRFIHEQGQEVRRCRRPPD